MAKIVKKKTSEKVVKPAKKAAAKQTKAPAKKVSKKRVAKVHEPVTPIKETMNKSELFNHLAESTEVDLKTVKKIMAELEATMLGSLAPKGAGEFTLPGVAKFFTRKVPAKKVPARKAGTLVRNPATGEMVKAEARAAFTKPATVKVKVRALSKIKKAAIHG